MLFYFNLKSPDVEKENTVIENIFNEYEKIIFSTLNQNAFNKMNVMGLITFTNHFGSILFIRQKNLTS